MVAAVIPDNGACTNRQSTPFGAKHPIPAAILNRRPTETQMADINTWIDNELKSNDVVLFMKGTPQFPMCGFSGQVVQMLDFIGVPYKGHNVLENAELRDGIKTYTNWPTIPQLYVKGEFVGGCDIVREMFQSGELQSHLAEKGIKLPAKVS
jgi:monothiol glutaredoxin